MMTMAVWFGCVICLEQDTETAERDFDVIKNVVCVSSWVQGERSKLKTIYKDSKWERKRTKSECHSCQLWDFVLLSSLRNTTTIIFRLISQCSSSLPFYMKQQKKSFIMTSLDCHISFPRMLYKCPVVTAKCCKTIKKEKYFSLFYFYFFFTISKPLFPYDQKAFMTRC